ncbi:MAG: glycosidase, partial [Ruthenibacterium sp.]
GKPQVWYLDLFAGTNDYKAVEKFGEGGHKEINRTNLTIRQITDALKKDVVQKQLQLLRWRNTFPAFGFETEMLAEQPTNETIRIMWKQNKYIAVLEANLATEAFSVYGKKHNKVVFFMEES